MLGSLSLLEVLSETWLKGTNDVLLVMLQCWTIGM